LITQIDARHASIPDEFRYLGDGIDDAWELFRSAVSAQVDRFTHSAAM